MLASGRTLAPVEVAYETYGRLDDDGGNAVVVCHALTGDARAAGDGGWWRTMVGPGLPVDTDRYFVVSSNLLGGCRGTTGPSSTDPRTGRPYGPDFPLLALSDLVAVQRRLLAHLGVERLHAAVGGSLGGMQVLQWVIDDPGFIDRAVVVAASSRLSAENIAFSAVGREAITSDPDWHGGRYLEHGTLPRTGLKVARMAAHITYVAAQTLEGKFGRARRSDGPPSLEPDFEVEHYLRHQGEGFVERFDALTYVYLTRLLDYVDPFADPATAEALRRTRTRFQLTSFDSDWRFDTAQSRRLLEQLHAHGVRAEHAELASPHGHDSFLLTPPGYLDRVRSFLTDPS